MATEQFQKMLQEIWILGTGQAANAESIAIMERMSDDGASLNYLIDLVNSYMNELSARHGTARPPWSARHC